MADNEEKKPKNPRPKLEDAKAEGNIAKSMEITGAAVLTIGLVYLMFFFVIFFKWNKETNVIFLWFYRTKIRWNSILCDDKLCGFTLLKVLAPLFALVLIASIVSNLYQFGIL